MLLAAGLGTRLRPFTDHTPKALVDVGGVPVLERVALRLIAAGADRLIVNTHHFREQIERYILDRNGWGVEVRISAELHVPLGTGGGLLHARPHFRGDRPFFLHNADILTDADLPAIYRDHLSNDRLATLAVMERPTQRYLLFDSDGLCGRVDEGKNIRIQVREPVDELMRVAFAGIHVISPAIFSLFAESGAFSILDTYLRLAGEGYRIRPFRIDGARWFDIGRVEQLERARVALAESGVQ